jgi:hypothetical protein
MVEEIEKKGTNLENSWSLLIWSKQVEREEETGGRGRIWKKLKSNIVLQRGHVERPTEQV